MLFLSVVFITFIVCLAVNKIFDEFKLYKKNYRDKQVPYSGGTILFISLSLAFVLFYFFGEISYIKMFFFLFITASIYMIGMLDDLFGINDIKGLKGNIYAVISKRFSTGIVKAVLTILIACYLYYFFNEEYWFLKGILTALTTNLFNLFDLRPGRCIKLYYLFFIFFSFSYIRWTRELFIIFSIIITVYYFWDAYGFSMLGDSGANLMGFIIGLILSEIIGTNLFVLLVLSAILIVLQLFLDKYSLTDIIGSNYLLDYADIFLTERQGRENVKS